jgi:NUMOD3 motif
MLGELKMFIYVIVCDESLKLYVGQHQGADLRKYLSKKFFDAFRYTRGNSHLFNAMRKHPRDSWSIHPLISGIESKAELDEQERLLIYALKTQHPDVGYNICDGGEGRNGPMSEDAKRKISENHKQNSSRWHRSHRRSPEEMKIWRDKVTGQKRTVEQAQRIAEGRRGKGMGDANANHRNGLTEEHRKKIAQAHVGMKHTEASRRKMSGGRKGRIPWNKGLKSSRFTNRSSEDLS